MGTPKEAWIQRVALGKTFNRGGMMKPSLKKDVNSLMSASKEDEIKQGEKKVYYLQKKINYIIRLNNKA